MIPSFRGLAFALSCGGLQAWLGWFFGFLVALLFVPGAVVFPVVHWLVEDAWPTTYLYCMAVSFAAYVLATVLRTVTEE